MSSILCRRPLFTEEIIKNKFPTKTVNTVGLGGKDSESETCRGGSRSHARRIAHSTLKSKNHDIAEADLVLIRKSNQEGRER